VRRPSSNADESPDYCYFLDVGTIFQFPYRTVAEVSIPALIRNLHTLRALVRKEILPVVKADAYGHGIVPIAKALIGRGSCAMLAVATLEEAMEIRKKVSHHVQILVLSGFLPHQLDAYLKYHLTPMIHSLFHLRSLHPRKTLPDIHLKIDTGMHRLGLLPSQLDEACRLLEKMDIKLSGLATHFAESENVTSKFSDNQLKIFQDIYQMLGARRLLHTDVRVHVANSGGILNRRLGISNAVRPGIALYGISPNIDLKSELLPVLSWKTRILSFKEVRKGETVGYGRTYRAPKKERLALLPIGYADGYPRHLSRHGQVLISGKRCPIRGRVSMDLTAVDVSSVPGCREGALVTLIGRSAKEEISATDLAVWVDTIPYEILCGISSRVPRIYLD